MKHPINFIWKDIKKIMDGRITLKTLKNIFNENMFELLFKIKEKLNVDCLKLEFNRFKRFLRRRQEEFSSFENNFKLIEKLKNSIEYLGICK